MEASLPSTLDFGTKIPELPDGVRSTQFSIQTSNGISFTPGQILQFDLPSRSGLFIDGKSVFIRYNISYTSGATAGIVRRKPVYTTFSRLDEFVASVPVNSVFAYNQVANMWVDTNFSAADVLGQQASWGLIQTPNILDLDGVPLTANATQTISVSAPLCCSFLSSCDKLIPTGLMAPIRVQLTVDSIFNQISVPANVSAIVVSQPELCFNGIDMGMAVEQAIAMSSPQLVLKSQGWANSTQSVASGTSGFNTLSFNHRYKSIENLYFLSSSTSVAKGANAWGDSLNALGLSNINGSIQAQIGQDIIPQLPLNNATGGLASIQQYLRECVGFISDNRNTMSVFNTNFFQYAGDGTATTTDAPAKFIVGFPLSKINAPSPYQQVSLMSGTDASTMPINVLLNIGTAYNTAMSHALIAQYTCLLMIDPASKQVSVVC